MGLNNFPLLAVPFFLCVGQAMNESGTSVRLIDFSRPSVGYLKGGLVHVNVAVSMIFAGISGVSSADPMGVGSVMIPVLVVGGILGGVFTATEASVVAVLYLLLLSLGVLALVVFFPDLILWIPRAALSNLMQGSVP